MTYIKRRAEGYFSKLLTSPKVTMVLGARQVGKTTLVWHVLENKKALFLNLDTDVDKNRLLASSSLSPKEAILSFGSPEYLVIDEAQRLPETGRIVKGWYDAGIPLKIVLLGSSSLNLLDQSAESLTGRNEKLFLTPLFFEEILSVQPWYSSVFSSKESEDKFGDQIQSHLWQSLVFGSYPETVTVGDRAAYLINLVSDYLLKDVLQLGLIKTPDLIKRLLNLLAYQVGSEVSVNELAANLGISRITVEKYLDLLEQTFVIFRLPAFSTNSRKEIVKSKKIYFWDTGIMNALIGELSVNPLRSDIGRLWENWAIAEVAKRNIQTGGRKTLYFWRSRVGSEVDLILKENEKMQAFEIKWNCKKKIKAKAFFEKYHVPVAVIDNSRPLSFLEEIGF